MDEKFGMFKMEMFSFFQHMIQGKHDTKGETVSRTISSVGHTHVDDMQVKPAGAPGLETLEQELDSTVPKKTNLARSLSFNRKSSGKLLDSFSH